MFSRTNKKEGVSVNTANVPFYSDKYDEIQEIKKLKRKNVYLKLKKIINKFRVSIIIIFYLVVFLLIYWYIMKYYEGNF